MVENQFSWTKNSHCDVTDNRTQLKSLYCKLSLAVHLPNIAIHQNAGYFESSLLLFFRLCYRRFNVPPRWTTILTVSKEKLEESDPTWVVSKSPLYDFHMELFSSWTTAVGYRKTFSGICVFTFLYILFYTVKKLKAKFYWIFQSFHRTYWSNQKCLFAFAVSPYFTELKNINRHASMFTEQPMLKYFLYKLQFWVNSELLFANNTRPVKVFKSSRVNLLKFLKPMPFSHLIYNSLHKQTVNLLPTQHLSSFRIYWSPRVKNIIHPMAVVRVKFLPRWLAACKGKNFQNTAQITLQISKTHRAQNLITQLTGTRIHKAALDIDVSVPVFPLKKFDTEQMFVLVRMQLRNHVDVNTQAVKRFRGYVIYIRF